jgi:hypothetical protein
MSRTQFEMRKYNGWTTRIKIDFSFLDILFCEWVEEIEWHSGEYKTSSNNMALSAYSTELPFRESVSKIPSERTAQVCFPPII